MTNKKKLFKQITIIGLGLIGSSLALSIKKSKISSKTVGYSRSSKTRNTSKRLNLVDKVSNKLEESVRGSDLIIICTPLSSYSNIIKKIIPHISKGTIISDVGSAKEKTINEIIPLLSNDDIFIPAHPIAGTEKSGPSAGFAELFDDRWCICLLYTSPSPRD